MNKEKKKIKKKSTMSCSDVPYTHVIKLKFASTCICSIKFTFKVVIFEITDTI